MNLPPGGTVCLDSSVLVALFTGSDSNHEASLNLFEAVLSGTIGALVSTIAAAEVLVRPLRRDWREEVVLRQAVLRTTPNISLHPVDWRVALRGAAVRARHGLSLPDALIIASAMDCDALASGDRRALSVAEAEGIQTVPLRAN